MGLALQEPSERSYQSQVVEHRGPQMQREATHLFDRLVDQGNADGKVLRSVVCDAAPGRLQVQTDGRQGLPEVVMQLSSERPPLCLLGFEQPT